MSNTDRAADIIAAFNGAEVAAAEALAAADPPLLVTDEIQAVLDAVANWRPKPGSPGALVRLMDVSATYLASRGEP